MQCLGGESMYVISRKGSPLRLASLMTILMGKRFNCQARFTDAEHISPRIRASPFGLCIVCQTLDPLKAQKLLKT